MRDTAVQHHNHNQVRLIVWAEDNSGPESSKVDNDFSNMQWMVKEVIHKNNNEFLATQLQSGITIWSVSEVSYHPNYQYGTSSWIIKYITVNAQLQVLMLSQVTLNINFLTVVNYVALLVMCGI